MNFVKFFHSTLENIFSASKKVEEENEKMQHNVNVTYAYSFVIHEYSISLLKEADELKSLQ